MRARSGERTPGGAGEHHTLRRSILRRHPLTLACCCRGQAEAAGLGREISAWLDAVVSAVGPLALLGLSPQASLGAACLRVSDGLSRVPIHADGYHNTLLQLAGRRRLLLFMPDAAPMLYPTMLAQEESVAAKLGWGSPTTGGGSSPGRVAPSGSGGGGGGGGGQAMEAPVAQIDPRSLPHADYPGAESAPAFAVTLDPGDALHLPAGWWHYVETQAYPASTSTNASGSSSDGVGGQSEPSAAINIVTANTPTIPGGGGGGLIAEHPCASALQPAQQVPLFVYAAVVVCVGSLGIAAAAINAL